jgi:predicted amidohydrolase
MKIAAVQMVSTPDVARNRDAAARLVAQAAAAGAAAGGAARVLLPHGPARHRQAGAGRGPGDGPIQHFLADAARRARPVAGGRHAAAEGGVPTAQVLNRCCVFAPDGSLAARYDKIHLFAFDNGRESYDEGRTLRPAAPPVACRPAPLRVGLSICYDLRFPELYRALMQPPCDLLCVPAAFTYTTGQRALGAAAARARGGKPVLRARRGPGRHCTRTAAAPGATAWSSTPGARCWRCRPKAKAWSSPTWTLRIAQVRQQLPALAHRRL